MKAVWVCLFAVILAGAGCGGDGGGTAASDEAYPEGADEEMMPLAYIGDHPITVADLRNHMLKRSGPEKVNDYIRKFDIVQISLASLMDQIVWMKVAKEEGYDLTPTERAQVLALESELIATRYMGDVIQEKARPTQAQIEEFYNNNQDRYLEPTRVGVRHILVNTEAEAQELKTQVDGGADIAALARTRSIDEATRDIGGAVGFVEKGKEVLGLGRSPVFVRAMLALEPGDVAVVKTDKGWSVAKVERKEGGDLKPIAEVQERISQALMNQNFGRVYNEELQRARDTHEARFMASNLERLTGTKQNTRRLMQIATEQQEARGKIEVYRRITYDFPDSPEAAEATFMIAYLNLVDHKDRGQAEQFLKRLQDKYGGSKWAKAGSWLANHLDDDPATIPSPGDIAKEAQ